MIHINSLLMKHTTTTIIIIITLIIIIIIIILFLYLYEILHTIFVLSGVHLNRKPKRADNPLDFVIILN